MNIRFSKKQTEEYVKTVLKQSKKLSDEAQLLVRELVNEKNFVDGEKEPDYVDIVRDRLNEKGADYIWTLSDLFPKDAEKAIEILIGKENKKIFFEIAENITNWTFHTTSYYRRGFRSRNIRHYDGYLISILEHFVDVKIAELDVMNLIKKEYDESVFYYAFFPELIAYHIDKGDTEVIDLITDMMLSENNNKLLSRQIFEAILMSRHKGLNELLGKLLLAAKLQEGLRQSICESMNDGRIENFYKLFNIIAENDLVRFSSVKRAIATYTSIGEYNSDRITKKEIEVLSKLINGELSTEEFLQSQDVLHVHLALWHIATVDISGIDAAFAKLIERPEKHIHQLCIYSLELTKDNLLKIEIAKKVLRQYAEKAGESDDSIKEDLDIFVPYIDVLFRNFDKHYYMKSTGYYYETRYKNIFADESEAEFFLALMERVLSLFPKKEMVFSPFVFPWYVLRMEKSELCQNICSVALMYPVYKERVLPHILGINYWQMDYVKALIGIPKTKEEKDMIISIFGNRNSYSSQLKGIIQEGAFAKEYKEEFVSLLRLKTPEIRRDIISLIQDFTVQEQMEIIESLLSAKDVQKRLGGLDLLLALKKESKVSAKEIAEVLSQNAKPTDSEKVLIEQLIDGAEENKSSEELSTLYDAAYTPTPSIESLYSVRPITDPRKFLEGIFDQSEEQLFEIIYKLSELIEKHSDYEYKAQSGNVCLLGVSFYPNRKVDYASGQIDIEDYPLSDVWKEFYEENIRDFHTLWQLYIYLNFDKPNFRYRGDLADDGKSEIAVAEKIHALFGKDLSCVKDKLQNEEIPYFVAKYGSPVGRSIISNLFDYYRKKYASEYFALSRDVVLSVLSIFKIEELISVSEYNWREEQSIDLNAESHVFRVLLNNLDKFTNEEEFRQAFALKEYIERYYNVEAEKLARTLKNPKIENSFIKMSELGYAIALGIVPVDVLYKAVMDTNNSTMIRRVTSLSLYISGDLPNQKERDYTYIASLPETLEVLKSNGAKIIEYIVSKELKRGDTPTKYSPAIGRIKRVEGVSTLVATLRAMGKLKLDRNTWYWGYDESKKSTLSHLIKVSYPSEGENAETLRAALKGTDIDTQRLVEVAMYAPQWIPIIEEYLGWSGLASGCYYFHAHTSDIDKKKEGLFARYTPISIEDLKVGAFDIEWFKSAYAELGEEKFAMLYDAAKYISDGAQHGRARRFADAVLGKFDVAETEKEINEKRNKDLVASYALIPLSKKAKKKDTISRYAFLQNFLKESKQFGAQRRASEQKAFEIALDNLSRNAGYDDVTRLICQMETEIFESYKPYFTPKTIDELSVYLEMDDMGKTELVIEKSGKRIASVPAKYKKHEYIEEIKAVSKALSEQLSRSKKMLEESMELGTKFEVEEINALMTNHPILANMIGKLVLKTEDGLGYYKDGSLVGVDGEETELKSGSKVLVAHTLDLYHSGQWAEYQKDLFDRQLKQPFKQVFRELYLKTAEEKEMFESRRYDGHQVQPTRSVALLKTRRWVIDGDEGLQKVYYKDNIIAKIYAMADWFSPADMEDPTLEQVCFYDRKTKKAVKIADVPEMIFTEVMRDLDLVVSVAHTGGVDPEASHSTIEMRRAIVSHVLPLFKLSNVTLLDNHALIKGTLAEYSIHLGSGIVHQKAGSAISVLPVHSQHRGRIFMPFVDEDPKTAEIISKIVLFAEDGKIKDPIILEQIR